MGRYFKGLISKAKANKSENRNFTANKTVEYLHCVVCE